MDLATAAKQQQQHQHQHQLHPETPKQKLSGGEALAAFSNGGGALKRPHPAVVVVKPVASSAPPSPPAALYRECLKNHAASLGGHALDGCGEFMPSPLSSPSDPTSLKCAACGCHRNFHRRDDDPSAAAAPGNSAASDDFVNGPGGGDVTPKRRSSSSASPPPPPPPPPPISSSYFPSAPQMLLALSTGLAGGGGHHHHHHHSVVSAPVAARKRFRTKFSREQKERMFLFAEKLGWKLQKQDERVVEEFCGRLIFVEGASEPGSGLRWVANGNNSWAMKKT
ncbi:hypothetical protein H6P81_011264 [Aristolochia fimbriata]|uniref:ZF-HD dimerization-type domain-containing protein n=1 Tax=Aristolochia fimbriata TaxID=158543 RepID=A0AAV7ESA6_ARIFI|nr:hypothetical protein H6P81_011264 [Aristolochia fimbriata]